MMVRHTQASSKRVFLVLDSSTDPIATLTPARNNALIELSCESGGPGRLTRIQSQEGEAPYEARQTYILFCSQSIGNGRGDVKTTLMSASAISFARMCASVAPEKVSLSFRPVSASNSALRLISVAMTSAPSTETTRGIMPYERVNRTRIKKCP